MAVAKKSIPAKLNFDVKSTMEEFSYMMSLEDRRLYLYGEVAPVYCEESGVFLSVSLTSKMVEDIFSINREDTGIPVDKREPIRLYINSPGGDLTEGMALISAIEIFKTPVYTINVGQWSSMAFLIGITGHKRYSLPNMTFLLHEGSSFAMGTSSKVQDLLGFQKRFDDEVVKKHVLKHSKMSEAEYESQDRKEMYMLPEDAMKYGFIDEIVTDIDEIL